ncbi:hypothetical protein Tco_0729437 [Tanacetum coccineum]|uniref:Transposase MuDR plant domain-containing protein n=1 Tax=Tanacetum coccineum TaxID=301880 RepID=A0ABQ4YQ51_9ASTR
MESTKDVQPSVVQVQPQVPNSEPVVAPVSAPMPNLKTSIPYPSRQLKVCEAKTHKSSIDEPPEVKLKDLPPHLEYAFLEGDNKFPVIIAKDLSVEEKACSHLGFEVHAKRAIAWKHLRPSRGINPEFCTHKIQWKRKLQSAVNTKDAVESKDPRIVIKWRLKKTFDADLFSRSRIVLGLARYIASGDKGVGIGCEKVERRGREEGTEEADVILKGCKMKELGERLAMFRIGSVDDAARVRQAAGRMRTWAWLAVS